MNHPFEKDIGALRSSISKTVLGKDGAIERAIVCLVAQGHILIEDVPGVGKTTLALAIANSIHGSFQRIQFTSDLLPSDVLGVTIYNSEKQSFEFKPGPVFANVLLADEINRTTPKTQSALLEAMQDGAITVDRETHELPKPFMVVATQNPIEFHGTYPLPESQLDRFLMKISMGYPAPEEEIRILHQKGAAHVQPNGEAVCTQERIIEMQRAVSEVRVDESLGGYMLEIVNQTRKIHDLELGCSPRGALALYRTCQGLAFVRGRTYVTPDDVKELAIPVLAHRLIVSGRRASAPTSQDSRTMAETILKEILASVEVPN